MLYQPSYPQPYFSDVDATDESTFSCYINADSDTQVSAYQLIINNLGGSEVYNSGQVDLDSPLYGNQQLNVIVPVNQLTNGEDYTWNIDLYEKDADIWITSGIMPSFPTTGASSIMRLRNNALIQVGMIVQNNNQKVKITSINTSNTDYLQVSVNPSIVLNAASPSYTVYDNKIQSNSYYFRARQTPTLVMEEIPSQINSKSYTFKATYSQAQNVGYKYFEWTIYDSVGNLLKRSGRINTGEIVYTFDGFLNNTIYGIGLTLENQDGVVLTLQPTYFDVSYDLPSFENTPAVELVCEKDAIKLSWSPLLINSGDASDTYVDPKPWYTYIQDLPYLGGSVVDIHENIKLYWYIGSYEAPIYVPYESTTYFFWHTENPDFRGVIYEQKGYPVALLTMGTIPPTNNVIKNDKYYNIREKLIYTAIDDNVWGNTGEVPRDDVIYYLVSNQQNYIWNGSDMINTDYVPPSYTVSYDAGKFQYTIINGDINITGEVKVADITNEWLLQQQNITKSNVYMWDNSKTWDDTLYWTEPTQSYLIDKWFKITLLPTEIQIIVQDLGFNYSPRWNGDITGLETIQYQNLNYYKIQDNIRGITLACKQIYKTLPSSPLTQCKVAGKFSPFEVTTLTGHSQGKIINCGQLWKQTGSIINIYTPTDEYPITGLYFAKYSSEEYTTSAQFYQRR